MMDFLFQIGISNACFALVLALLALVAGAKSRRPHLAHLLWMLVLIKLVTPPLFNVPIALPTAQAELTHGELATSSLVEPEARLPVFDIDENVTTVPTTQADQAWLSWFAHVWLAMKPWLGLIWLAGTSLIVVGSLGRVWRFHGLLKQSSQPANKQVQNVAEQLACQLGLKTSPSISITTARICPMVWWIGGRVHVVLPQLLLKEMSEDQWRWVLAHEFAHVRRRDYLVRWLEWFACACFWWNPIVWLAQQNLRASEELCCDELVLSGLNPSSHRYAESIFKAVESLVNPEIRPPAMASEINSGGFLERRIEMILSGKLNQKSSRTVQLLAVTLAMLLIPLGFAHAQDLDAVKKRLAKAVKKDEITFQQAALMMEALKQSAHVRENHNREQHLIELELIEREHAEMERAEMERTKLKLVERELVKLEKELHSTQAKLKQAYEEGHITREEFEKKLKGFEKQKRLPRDRRVPARRKTKTVDDGFDGSNKAEELRRLKYHEALIRMEEAVAAGEISEKDAKNRMADLKKMLWGQDKKDEKGQTAVKEKEELRELKYSRALVELEQAVQAGKISKKEARKKIEALKKKFSGGDKRDEWTEERSADDQRRLKFQAVEGEIAAMVKDGKMTKQQARDRLRELKQKLWEQSEQGEDNLRLPGAEQDMDFEMIVKKLEGAVDSGKMTRAEAEQTYADIKKRFKKKERADR